MVKKNAEMYSLWQEQRHSEEQCHDDEEYSPHNLEVKIYYDLTESVAVDTSEDLFKFQ